MIAYSSYAKEDPAASNMLFRNSVKNGMQLACTEPAALAGNTGNYRGSYMPTMFENSGFMADGYENLPKDITTQFIVYRDGNALTELSGLGLHLRDCALELDDLIDTVRMQTQAAGP